MELDIRHLFTMTTTNPAMKKADGTWKRYGLVKYTTWNIKRDCSQ
jgi:hypothetical protein